jgi:hypothetical protein
MLAFEVGHRGGGRAQQQRADVIGQDPVELLGHVAVERAHARLDVRDWHPRLRARQRTGEGRVGVPVHEQEVRRYLRHEPVQRR